MNPSIFQPVNSNDFILYPSDWLFFWNFPCRFCVINVQRGSSRILITQDVNDFLFTRARVIDLLTYLVRAIEIFSVEFKEEAVERTKIPTLNFRNFTFHSDLYACCVSHFLFFYFERERDSYLQRFKFMDNVHVVFFNPRYENYVNWLHKKDLNVNISEISGIRNKWVPLK